MKRAAELSLVGLIKVDNEKWAVYKELSNIVNELIWYGDQHYYDAELVKKYMKQNAEEMLDEIKRLLSPFEYMIVKELIENPPRETSHVEATEIIPTKRENKKLIEVIINGRGDAKTEKAIRKSPSFLLRYLFC